MRHILSSLLQMRKLKLITVAYTVSQDRSVKTISYRGVTEGSARVNSGSLSSYLVESSLSLSDYKRDFVETMVHLVSHFYGESFFPKKASF